MKEPTTLIGRADLPVSRGLRPKPFVAAQQRRLTRNRADLNIALAPVVCYNVTLEFN
jgi:hypothetical protein